MPETPFERILAVGTLLAAAALVAMVAMNWDSFASSPVPVTEPARVGQQAPVESVSLPRRPIPATQSASRTQNASRRSAPKQRRVAPPKKAELVIAATRGPSWLEVRAESSNGAQLYYGMLDQGSTTRFDRLPVWVRLGAAESVDVRLGGSPIESLPVGENGVVQFVASKEDVTGVSTG